ncbi:ATP-binding cassette domain-containing protein, partial [Patescibacteria group bacterium]|nr:ATP-binding cassette domain-containing protein [Patescibacteria group bacterium]
MMGYNVIIKSKYNTVIKVNNISKTFEGKIILADVSFSLGKNQKAALVGLNGVGKSTLLKIIAGSEKADSGAVEIAYNIRVGYLSQEIIFEEEETVQSYLKKISGLDKIESRMKEIEAKLNDPKLLEEYGNLQNEFTRMEGYSFDHRAKVILEGFGLKDIDSNRSLSELSGGQKSKVALAGILLKGFDILLLDEPTNNLDLPALIWLEQYINKITASCLIISHDRRFLDNVVSKVFEIDWHNRKINSYTGGYSDYIKYKEKEFLKQIQAYELQQEEIQKLKKATRDYKEWAKKGAKQTTSDHDKF